MANKLNTYIQNNKAELKRKALILSGVTVGLLVASGITEKLSRPRVTNVIVVNEIPDEVTEPSSEPLEP